MKYTASELVNQAFNLADLKNTDFISHQECIDYLQAAYTEVYNNIIKHGDKQFVVEARLHPASSIDGYTEYELPFDFYTLYSLKDPRSGRVLNRQSKSNAVNSGCYEIINDKLRVYGTSTAGDGLILTYWVAPLYITYPNRKIDTELSSYSLIKDTARNSALLEIGDHSYEVRNLVTDEQVSSFDVDSELEYEIYLGAGHIIVVTDNDDGSYTISYYNLDLTQKLYETTQDTVPVIVKDDQFNLYYTDPNRDVYKLNKKTAFTLEDDEGVIIGDELFQYNPNDCFDWNGQIYEVKIDKVTPAPDYDNMKSLYGFIDNIPKRLLIRSDKTIAIEGIEHDYLYGNHFVEYGVLGSNGTTVSIWSGIPETLMNFPNDVFYQLIAANLGIRFLMKQNADAEGLKAIYENMYSVFYNALGQDGSYQVVTNVH